LKIALFSTTFPPKVDGIATTLKHTVARLQKLGHQVLLITPDLGVREYCGAKILGLQGYPSPGYPEVMIAIPTQLTFEEIKKFNPDVVHVADPVLHNPLGMMGIYWSRMQGYPIVASYHTHFPEYLKYQFESAGSISTALWIMMEASYRDADLVLTGSNQLVNELISHGFSPVRKWPASRRCSFVVRG
jgi:glycosyltransferase involved in cell wall biosynthesis